MTFKFFAVRLGCFCLDLNLRSTMSFVLQFQFMKYEKIHTLMWPGMSASISQVKKYTFQYIYIDTYHSCYGLQVKDIYENEAIHCAYWTKKNRLFTMNLLSMLTCITETVFPSEKRELTSICNRHLIIKSLCTSIWKTCHCFPTANYWSISSVSGQC